MPAGAPLPAPPPASNLASTTPAPVYGTVATGHMYNTRSRQGTQEDISAHLSSAAKGELPRRNARSTRNNATERPKPPPAKPTVKEKKQPVKPAAQIYRFMAHEMPKDKGGLRDAMNLHIRILWGLENAKQTPAPPAPELLNSFYSRFSTEAQLMGAITQESAPRLVPTHLVQIGLAMSASKGRTARQARLVEEHMLSYMQACLSRVGLVRWCPDLRQTPYSLYNSACRIIALNTFRQALVSHTYIHLGPNLAYATDEGLLIKMFDHFVFHVMQERYQKELRNPGSVLQNLENTPLYNNRIRLAKARLDFLVQNGYRKRYRDLINPKATSDDEYDPVQKVWIIRRRPERSPAAEAFIRMLDVQREAYAIAKSPSSWKERRRVVPISGQPLTAFPAIPRGMPLDYFYSGFFNNLQPRLRYDCAVLKLSLLPLPLIHHSFDFEHPDVRLSDRAFNLKYKAVYEDYHIIRKEDIENDADDESESEEEGEGTGESDEDDMSVDEDEEDDDDDDDNDDDNDNDEDDDNNNENDEDNVNDNGEGVPLERVSVTSSPLSSVPATLV
ncbi:hypothetical protein JR316_0011532 [Psilocybe cubensis]|nr:hypothetical protein JR316_0011532 [Psilocybe cubensis]KAH9475967.1 hypothetical protein JR316_0011532 [Psilocybe cubensis]